MNLYELAVAEARRIWRLADDHERRHHCALLVYQPGPRCPITEALTAGALEADYGHPATGTRGLVYLRRRAPEGKRT